MSDSIKRRHFMAALGSLVAGASLAPRTARAVALPRPPLSHPPAQLASVYDVVVIGSGYGGAVMAARLAPGRSLAVLEHGCPASAGRAASRFPTTCTAMPVTRASTAR